MIALFVSGMVSLLVSGFTTPILIKILKSKGVGQQIREDGPQKHITKAGTPTMGGIAIVLAVIVGYLVGHLVGVRFSSAGIVSIITIFGAGLVGFADDWIKVKNQRNLGLSKKTKAGGQILLALIFAFLALNWVHLGTEVSFTALVHNYVGPVFYLSPLLWVLWAILVITGTSNAVNLTDGLDGLAAGASAFGFFTLVIIGYWQFRHSGDYNVHHSLDLALVAVSMAAACAGFLWWNAAPAQIFMGDTGSLAIGAGLAALSLQLKVVLLLPIMGALFVIVTLSVVIQVFSFKVFHKRVFRMAPLHHHFELGGWPETTVIVRFWILAALFTAIALGIFYTDFLAHKGIF